MKCRLAVEACEVVLIHAASRSFLRARYPPVSLILFVFPSRALFIFRPRFSPARSEPQAVVYPAPLESREFLRIKGARNAIREKSRSQIERWVIGRDPYETEDSETNVME